MEIVCFKYILQPQTVQTNLKLFVRCSNLDPLTETYGLPFYIQYLAHWPEYFQVAESPSGEIMGYSKSIHANRLKLKSICYLIYMPYNTVMGKAEGLSENWHGHVTALSVSPDYRRLGLAATLMNFLEDVSEKYVITFSCSCPSLMKYHSVFGYRKRCYFVDLFVRVSNKIAINMYTNLGYIVYRTVLEYYSGDPDEDAYGNDT